MWVSGNLIPENRGVYMTRKKNHPKRVELDVVTPSNTLRMTLGFFEESVFKIVIAFIGECLLFIC